MSHPALQLTGRFLPTQPDWIEWLASEYKDINQCDKHDMFGHPCIPPAGAAIFIRFAFTKIKEEDNNHKKACVLCHGSTSGSHAQ